MHILSDPSFFLTNKTGAPYGDLLGLMKPFSTNSLSWLFNSSYSLGDILYIGLLGGVDPGSISI